MKKIVLMLMLTLSIISCNKIQNLKKQISSSDNEKIDSQKILEYSKQKNELVKSFGIPHRWDTINYPYSIQYKQILATEKQLLINPKILDIFEINSKIIVRVSTIMEKEMNYNSLNEFIFDLVVDEIMLKKLLNYEYSYFFRSDFWEFDYDFEDFTIFDENKNYYPYYYMIVKINTLRKTPKVLFTAEAKNNFSYDVTEEDVGKTIYDEDNDIDIYNNIKIDFSDLFYYGKGKLIDFTHIKPKNFDKLIKNTEK